MANVDPSELAKFEASAERWWDKNSEYKALHDINPIRCNYIEETQPVAEKKVLDVGCGGGILSEALALRGASVTGIDLSTAPLEVAKLHALETGVDIDYQKVSAEDFAQDHKEAFDIVTCMEMLEHVPDPASIVRACASMVKPGGYLFLSTINRNPKSYGAMIVGAEYLLKIVPKGTHDYSKFIKPSELSTMVRHADLSIRDITGLVYNPLTKDFKLSPNDVDINYFITAQKPE
ncbi:bifunctional 2-polyprenyl-6-hydroxyphenol methylase/3-demethylubiquinol 3-O-methyltransferase UbiG [Sessilibacter corallicola]|uniref:Ubiquinone biosynthesis O-methyltransferase n=1 Tax=Sessilibacter corallicola TaxID=2904075 RepID=A0ABQ0AA14_9GAMM|nr:bifunctional 2-polyprenyl-6-hydroxyphenol methylase/3-demethylubiquinol 3-O-methyltransferase UbiG [Sessilibacter corallicola]MCE2029363.1 bifunctional 2-polyprenyl-6-hydroxyphenol methylase/3-demethylubiquinol 3-O-methyltransferase UbiG [Sessilibacter corallicola]